MLALYGQKLNFHLHLYLLSLRPCVGQGWHSAHTAPWRLEPVNQLSFDQWVSVSGYNRAHFYCPRFKFSHRDFVGEGAGPGWWSELQYHNITGPDGSHGASIRDQLVLTLSVSASRSSNPSSHPWPETNFQAVGIADNKIFKLKSKQQANTERGDRQQNVHSHLSSRGRGILCLESVRCIHNHKN